MKQESNQYSRLTVKSLKSCMGNEGYAYSATLYLDGKKVGYVRNDGNGGGCLIQFFKKVKGKPVRDVESEKKVLAYVEEQPEIDMGEHPRKPGGKWMMKPDLDWVVSQVCEEALADKERRRWCRTQVCFRIKGDPEGNWRTIKGKWKTEGREIKEYLVKKYGDQIEEILNERYS